MRKFLFNCLCLGGICIVLIIIFHLFLAQSRNKLLKLPQNITTLYIGNSTIECAINDSVLPNTCNFARRAEPINYTYAKIKLLKKINPQIDTIILGFDDLVLFYSDIVYRTGPSLYFLDQYDINDWRNNIKNNSLYKNSKFISHQYDFDKIFPMVKSYFTSDVSSSELEIGGHLKLKKNKLDRDIKERRKNSYKPNSINSLSRNNKYYFDKIIEFCEENDLKLVFFCTPKHKEVWRDSCYKEIHQKYYSNIPLYDYLQYDLSDCCYSDCVHLNEKGALLFSKHLNQLKNCPK